MFYTRLKQLCDERGLAITSVVLKAGGKLGTMNGWRNGSSPRADIVVAIANYLDVSADYLLGLPERSSETDPDIIHITELLHDCSKSDLSEILSYVEFKAQKNLEAKKDASA
jgi:transcriptional regulator with XRE-family HTH domain